MSTNQPPEVLECIASHLLALTWLANEVQSAGDWVLSDRDELVKQAQLEGVKRYRRMSPLDIAEVAGVALANYQAIAQELNLEQALDHYQAIAQELNPNS